MGNGLTRSLVISMKKLDDLEYVYIDSQSWAVEYSSFWGFLTLARELLGFSGLKRWFAFMTVVSVCFTKGDGVCDLVTAHVCRPGRYSLVLVSGRILTRYNRKKWAMVFERIHVPEELEWRAKRIFTPYGNWLRREE